MGTSAGTVLGPILFLASVEDIPAHINPKFADESSKRRKIVDEFEINLNRCILCGICVDVCNFDAIVMTHEHEESGISRDGSRMDLSGLLEIGGRYQTQTGWQPSSKD